MRFIKRWVKIVLGVPTVILGVILMPVPGPGGLPVTLAGLAILATEIPWVHRKLEWLKERIQLLRSEKKFQWIRLGIIVGLIIFYIAVAMVIPRILAKWQFINV